MWCTWWLLLVKLESNPCHWVVGCHVLPFLSVITTIRRCEFSQYFIEVHYTVTQAHSHLQRRPWTGDLELQGIAKTTSLGWNSQSQILTEVLQVQCLQTVVGKVIIMFPRVVQQRVSSMLDCIDLVISASLLFVLLLTWEMLTSVLSQTEGTRHHLSVLHPTPRENGGKLSKDVEIL